MTDKERFLKIDGELTELEHEYAGARGTWMFARMVSVKNHNELTEHYLSVRKLLHDKLIEWAEAREKNP